MIMDGGPFFFLLLLLLSSFVATCRVANLLQKLKNFGRVATDRRRGNDRLSPMPRTAWRFFPFQFIFLVFFLSVFIFSCFFFLLAPETTV